MRNLTDLEGALCNALIDPIRDDLFPDAQSDRDTAIEDLRQEITDHPDNDFL